MEEVSVWCSGSTLRLKEINTNRGALLSWLVEERTLTNPFLQQHTVVETGLTIQQTESLAWFCPEKILQSFWFYVTGLEISEKWEKRDKDCIISGMFCGVYNRLLFMISAPKYILIVSCTNKENMNLKTALSCASLATQGLNINSLK